MGTDVADYDRDGFLDFRVLSGWGSGGSWFNYYRFDGSKYVEWKEPAELGTTFLQPEKYYACAAGRAGPSWAASHYRIENGGFVLYERERYPENVPESDDVLITDTVRKDRVVHRKVEVRNPWEDDADAKTVFDKPVDEPVDRASEQD